MNPNKTHFYWLDALRFVAAFVVLFSHTRNDFFLAYGDLPTSQQGAVPFIFYTLGRLGHEAVVVFFVLSGFLVGGRGFERIKDGTMNVKSYAIDRFARIYPPLFVSILFYFITCQFVKTETWNWGIAAGNFLNLQGIACESLVTPFWSLSYEWWFYIVFGALAISLLSKNSVIRLLGFVIACSSSIVFLVGDMHVHYLVIWFMGALAYITKPNKKNKVLFITSILGIVLFVGLYQISKETRSVSIPIVVSNPAIIEMLLTICMCIFIQQIILFEPHSAISKCIEKSLGYMGNFSYTLYLSHRIVLMWIFYYIFKLHNGDMTTISLLEYSLVVAFCLIICWLLSLVSERYTPQIKKHMKNIIIK